MYTCSKQFSQAKMGMPCYIEHTKADNSMQQNEQVNKPLLISDFIYHLCFSLSK